MTDMPNHVLNVDSMMDANCAKVSIPFETTCYGIKESEIKLIQLVRTFTLNPFLLFKERQNLYQGTLLFLSTYAVILSSIKLLSNNDELIDCQQICYSVTNHVFK